MTERHDLFVLRHGQTEWNAEGRHQGRRDSALTSLGRRQSAEQGCILAQAPLNPAKILCFASPQGRAWSTAEIALAAIGRAPVPDPRLQEVCFGQWEGLTGAEIDANWPGHQDGIDAFQWHFTAPGGERFEELQARARSFLDDLTGPAILVTHGITSRVLRGLWLGLGFEDTAHVGGGQGVVYHLSQGSQTRLDPPIQAQRDRTPRNIGQL